ncbi:unnamed protein product [Moneuplotes crassus]|uniref:Uncharacterized protein n=1 Tax=Euplotes crassus TaxID=5936 RepID=A0AAD1XAK8_EUPCR|nr:unnamed protein product [Moneuplotes crassus]
MKMAEKEEYTWFLCFKRKKNTSDKVKKVKPKLAQIVDESSQSSQEEFSGEDSCKIHIQKPCPSKSKESSEELPQRNRNRKKRKSSIMPNDRSFLGELIKSPNSPVANLKVFREKEVDNSAQVMLRNFLNDENLTFDNPVRKRKKKRRFLTKAVNNTKDEDSNEFFPNDYELNHTAISPNDTINIHPSSTSIMHPQGTPEESQIQCKSSNLMIEEEFIRDRTKKENRKYRKKNLKTHIMTEVKYAESKDKLL